MPTLSSYPALQNFLEKESAATIAVAIDQRGTIHAASLLYFHTKKPLRLYFVTSKNSEKCRLLKTEKNMPCACVIGTEKSTAFTLQMRGRIAIANPSQLQEVVENYYLKRGNRHDDLQDAATILLQFVPSWARFTDYSAGYDRLNLDLRD